jgi:hypothetical protein
MNPGPGDAGLPPNKGLTQAATVTKTEKAAIRQIVFLCSVSFILNAPCDLLPSLFASFLPKEIDVHCICF